MIETYETFQTIVQDTAEEIGLTIIQNNVLTSTDTDATQLARFTIATCEELLTKFPWRHYIGNDPWVQTVDGTYKYDLVADTDTPQMDSRLIKLGARWRYLNGKGLSYAEDFRSYQLRISSFAFDKNRQMDVNMNREDYQ